MPVVIVKPPCGVCGRTDLPVYWALTPPLCDVCYEKRLAHFGTEIASAALASLRGALAPVRNAGVKPTGKRTDQ